ncbi:CrfX protein, partial [Pseudomonas yangonensis]|uniref:CrfX protein n=1 Tax=Pseudomonas yangonensis TaxID=2579922 RepID=UPI001379DE4B
MPDPFEESPRDLLRSSPSRHDADACLHRDLSTANSRVSAGALFSLTAHWAQAPMIPLNIGSAPVAPVSP